MSKQLQKHFEYKQDGITIHVKFNRLDTKQEQIARDTIVQCRFLKSNLGCNVNLC